MLRQAAISAAPTRHAQKICQGIQDGTTPFTSLRKKKCCNPKIARGTAKNVRPNGASLCTPVSHVVCLRNVRVIPRAKRRMVARFRYNELPVSHDGGTNAAKFAAWSEERAWGLPEMKSTNHAEH